MTLNKSATTGAIRRASSCQTEAKAAVREVADKLAQPELALILFFAAPTLDREDLASQWRASFPGVQVIGCTSAGEIGPTGYLDGALTALSFGSSEFAAEAIRLDNLQHFEVQEGQRAGQNVRQRLIDRGYHVDGANTFGLLLVDGLSVREEAVVSSLYLALGDIEMIGGSAGDGLSFRQTFLYHNGAFHSDCAIYLLVHTSRPFLVFQTQHFESGSERMVVTKADVERRVVTEINGNPAGREYARLVGLNVAELTPMIFADHPVVVRVGGKPYVRSIQKVNEDESLTFFCSIDEGLVLRVAKGVDLIENLRSAFANVQSRIGQPIVTIGCDCILRYLEIQNRNLRKDVSQILSQNNVFGFSTYGEQYNGMHVNQTFTGVAIGGGLIERAN